MFRITNKKIVMDIQRLSDMISPQKGWKTPKIISEKNEKDLIPYIRGFWDAEGGLPKQPLTAKQRYLSFDQKNKESLDFIRKNLIKIGFQPTNLTFTNQVWQFRLARKDDMIKYINKISSSHPEKFSRMQKMVSILSP